MDSGDLIPITTQRPSSPSWRRRFPRIAAALMAVALIATLFAVSPSSPTPVSAGDGGGSEKCYEQITEYKWTRTLKAQKQVKGWKYESGSWQQADSGSWYPVPDSLQPPHYGEVAPTGNLPYGAYGIPASGVPYRYEVYEPEFQWSVTKPQGDGWTKTGETRTVNGNQTACPKPPDKEPTYTEWIDGQWECGDTEVTQTRTKTTYTWVLDGYDWVLQEATETQTQPRPLTDEEKESCEQPEPSWTVDVECDSWSFTNGPVGILFRLDGEEFFAEPGQVITNADAPNAETLEILGLDGETVLKTYDLKRDDCEPPYECPEGEKWVDLNHDEVVDEDECFADVTYAMSLVLVVDCAGEYESGTITVDKVYPDRLDPLNVYLSGGVQFVVIETLTSYPLSAEELAALEEPVTGYFTYGDGGTDFPVTVEVQEPDDCEPPYECPPGMNPVDKDGDGVIEEGECETPPPVDVCPNINGNQPSVPEGLVIDDAGNCVTPPVPPTDVCPNIEGVQETVPSGMVKDNAGNCVTPTPPPAPTDVCPNLDGAQLAVPSGMVKDNAGNCVTPTPPPAPTPTVPPAGLPETR